MYKIYADDVCIYDDESPLEAYKLIDPKLSLADSAAGSLTFTLPPTNIGYDSLQRLTTEVIVKKNGTSKWWGRVLSEEMNYWKCKKVTCEGALAFLNDTVQPPKEYHPVDEEGGYSVTDYLKDLINIHNSKVSQAGINKQFEVRNVTVTDENGNGVYRYSNYETTLECINEKLVERLGGHLVIEKVDDVYKLDYLNDDSMHTTTQVIRFGKNLLDYTHNFSIEDFATVIVPKGSALDEDDYPEDFPSGLYAYLDVSSCDAERYHPEGSIYVYDTTGDTTVTPNVPPAISTYGWVEKVVEWDDVTVASRLLTKAKNYLTNLQFDKMTLELSAMDLHYMNVSEEEIDCGDQVRVVSAPHGMDRYFPVSKLEIPLDNPADSKFTLNTETTLSLTSTTKSASNELKQAIENLPTEGTILEKAMTNAGDLINSATSGYINIIQGVNGAQALVITDVPDYTQATKTWVWNQQGLGFKNGPYTDRNADYSVAITQDGSISASAVTTGTLNASVIKAGHLKDQNGGNVFDLDLDNGTLSIGALSALQQSITEIESQVNSVNSSLTDEINDVKTTQTTFSNSVYDKLGYLRVVTLGSASQPAIVIGTTGNTDVKLRLESGCVRFFSGPDNGLPGDTGFATYGYFTSQEVYDKYLTADEALQVGAYSGTYHNYIVKNQQGRFSIKRF